MSTGDAPAFRKVNPADIPALAAATDDLWAYLPRNPEPEDGDRERWLQAQAAMRLCLPEGTVLWFTTTPAGRRDERLEAAGLLPALTPADATVLWRQKGDEARRTEDYVTAESAYRQALAANPDDLDAQLGLAAALLGVGRPQEALPYLETVVQKRPDSYWAHRLLGNASAALGFPERAVNELERALALDAADPVLLWDLARAQARAGQTAAALKSIDLLLSRSDARSLHDEAGRLREELE